VKSTPTPLQKATAVKPWMNAIILSRKRETGKATPVKVWRFTCSYYQKKSSRNPGLLQFEGDCGIIAALKGLAVQPGL
jgi:hypothetical protein